MALYLRKVIHPEAHTTYRAILKRDEGEFEIGSGGTAQLSVVLHKATTQWTLTG